MSAIRLVQIYKAGDPMEARHIQAVLQHQGIDATVMGESLAMAWPQVPPYANTQPTVWVKETDVRHALEILALPKQRTTTRGDEWICAQCGKSVEPQFAACWNCCTPREGD